jgi:hypothetical protein
LNDYDIQVAQTGIKLEKGKISSGDLNRQYGFVTNGK